MSPIKILHGSPSPEELAAVLAVVSARAAANAARPPDHGPTSQWADRARNLRVPAHPGPDAWRASAWARA
ncbi:acyl-CoA carboxylase epsilon subunit [Streptacidiphilus carbonis]|uniref:acyl-CoA carboxylase epsilon subunit n=1 Tax=Streptacidiphilus carbonis TaxID=105422 RepID=UPI0005A8C98A|nr:acyl-CoA carboxylase epsilon subunit [Streptacidiphilus carbonis]